MRSPRIQTPAFLVPRSGQSPSAGRAARGPAHEKLQVVVKLEPSAPAACVMIRGRLTEDNVQVIYALGRRVTVAVPGADISVDLSAADVSREAVAQLSQAAESGTIPTTANPSGTSCRLRILQGREQMA